MWLRHRLIAVLVLSIIVKSAPTDAQPFVQPFIAFTEGGRAGCAEAVRGYCDDARLGFGVSGGFLGDAFGVEGDFSNKPNFFGAATATGVDATVTTLKVDVLVLSPPERVRIFATAGAGMARTSIQHRFLGARSELAWVLALSAGAHVALSPRLRLRGELGWFQMFGDPSSDLGVSPSLATTAAGYFYRTSIGLMICF